MGKIILTGTMSCAPNEIETVLALLPVHIELTLAEPGCLEFDLWQDDLKPTEFHVTEVFRDDRALDAHQERTRKSDWFRVTGHMHRAYQTSTA